MSKFEIGKWYSWSQRGMQPQYGKVSELQGCTVHMSPWIIKQTSYDDSGYFDPRNSTDIKEISIDVVRKFLPVGHPDLEEVKGSSSTLTELPEKWCISRNLSEYENDAVTGWVNKKFSYGFLNQQFEDTYYVIVNGKVESGMWNKKQCNDEGVRELNFDQFKKWVLKEETPDTPRFKFKVGDEVNYKNSKITAVSNGLEYGWLTDSRVSSCMIESCHVSKSQGNCYKVDNLFITENGMTLAAKKLAEPPNPNTTEQWTPKVGEWVVMTDDYCQLLKKGEVFQIVKPQLEGDEYFVVRHDGNKSYLAPGKHQFRKALPHEIPSPTNESLLEEAKAVGLEGSREFSPTVKRIDPIPYGGPKWEDVARVYFSGVDPIGDYEMSVTKMPYHQVEELYGINFADPVDLVQDENGRIIYKKSSSTAKPSPKITVNKEVNIKTSKPKQIKLF